MNHLQCLLFGLICLLAACAPGSNVETEPTLDQPMVSFTFDDGITKDLAGYAFEDWNAMILNALDLADLKATFFVTGFNKIDEKGQYLLETWDSRGHQIANHTYSHPSFNSKQNTAEIFAIRLPIGIEDI
ncbi:MAG: polysaccharide deacetylase family protein [Bacteroidota bacterium]